MSQIHPVIKNSHNYIEIANIRTTVINHADRASVDTITFMKNKKYYLLLSLITHGKFVIKIRSENL